MKFRVIKVEDLIIGETYYDTNNENSDQFRFEEKTKKTLWFSQVRGNAWLFVTNKKGLIPFTKQECLNFYQPINPTT